MRIYIPAIAAVVALAACTSAPAPTQTYQAPSYLEHADNPHYETYSVTTPDVTYEPCTYTGPIPAYTSLTYCVSDDGTLTPYIHAAK